METQQRGFVSLNKASLIKVTVPFGSGTILFVGGFSLTVKGKGFK
jgi:hypothetical protein